MSAGGQTSTPGPPGQLPSAGPWQWRWGQVCCGLPFWPRRPRLFLACLLLALALILIAKATQGGVALHYVSLLPITSLPQDPRCPHFLQGAARGSWVPLPMTPDDVRMMDEFHITNLRERGLNPWGQRQDEKCGNVSFAPDPDKKKSIYHPLFRALCDPRGPRPCCHQGRCVNRTAEQCGCEECYDWRRQPQAEFARWETSDPRCQPLNFTGTQACRFLGNATLVFFGDSMIRDFFCALLMLLREDFRFGALDPKAPEDVKRKCEGLKMFGMHPCRMYTKGFDSVCGGKVRAYFFQYQTTKHLGLALTSLRQFLHQQPAFLVAGMGLHDQLDVTRGMEYVTALHDEIRKANTSWPHLTWVTPNAPGLLRSDVIDPAIFAQNTAVFRRYHEETTRRISELGVPVMDTWALTAGAVSFDGIHVGLGLNLHKCQVLLTYLQRFLATPHSPSPGH